MINDNARNLNLRIIKEIKENSISGYVVTIDDMTSLILAEKHAAWSDIARKIAHEVKNPLTPIKLSAERIEKKYNELNSIYEEMLNNPQTNLLGLRGLMEQNIRAQDYHHAFVYGEKLFYLNPRIDRLYETLVNIIAKTNNWHKFLQINDQSLQYKIIDKKTYSDSKSIAFFEIAKILGMTLSYST